MVNFTKRLEIRIDEASFHLLEQRAKETHSSIGELIRKAIREQYLKNKTTNRQKACQALFKINAPVSDWKKMKREIEKAHG